MTAAPCGEPVSPGFQAGPSRITIPRQREAFRSGFRGLDPGIEARFGGHDIDRLMGEAAAYARERAGGAPIVNNGRRRSEAPAQTPLSRPLSRGRRQCGSNSWGR